MTNFEYPPIGGGAGQAHSQLLREYAGMEDLHVDVVTAGLRDAPLREQAGERIWIHRVRIDKRNLHYWRKGEVLRWLWGARQVYDRLAAEKDYDLAHAFFAFPSGYLCYRQRGRMPYIVSLRGSDVPGYNVRLGVDYVLLKGLFGRIWRNAAAVMANSNGLRDLAARFVADREIGVITNGVDTATFCAAEEAPVERPLRAVTVCRLIARKRIDVLIDAVAAAAQRGLDMTLTIAGEGNLLDELRGHAERAGVLERVTFLGRTPGEQMPEVYRQHHVFLMSSAHEGMSNAMLEAMASGLPIVTTRCEGVEELIGENGVVVDEVSGAAMADAVAALAHDAARYARAREAALTRAGRFSWAASAQAYVDLYRQIIARGAGEVRRG